ncbi:MAG: hypothetical protein AB7I50_17660 [Vicinamibacterales bacterium]
MAFTWPLALGLGRDVPRDLGDSLLNSWILGWNASHFGRALTGEVSALQGLWHGNIFHPNRYTLAYSELLVAQSVQILPVYLLTGNLVLCYNLLFLSAFFLSGLGMFLLVRAYVNDWRVAFLAGALFAFTPYRVNQSPHIQVMTSQWMPFVLYGFHRFVSTRRVRAVVGAAFALVAQNLSCGYFMLFFAPFVPLHALFEINRQRAWTDRRVWTGFAVAGVLVAALTLPFMSPYLAARDIQGTRRSRAEIQLYSADAWSWLSADDHLRWWGSRLRLYVKPEGQVFPGFLPLALTIAGGVALVRRTRSRLAAAKPSTTRGAHAERLLLILAACAAVGAAFSVSGLAKVFGMTLPGPLLRFENHLIALLAAALGLVFVSERARRWMRAFVTSPFAFAVVCAGLAWYLSLGPTPEAAGRPVDGPRLYAWLLDHVPGWDGLRVPARFAMIAVLFLSLAAAWGVKTLTALTPRAATAAWLVALVCWFGETWTAPITLNSPIGSSQEGIGNSPGRIPNGSTIPPLARFLLQLPESAVIAEFPFGAGGWEMYYTYYSTLHWRRLVNGFSGYEPRNYSELARELRDPYRNPEDAWRLLRNTGATHVVVHGQAYTNRDRPAPYDWLAHSGARFVARIGTDEIYDVPAITQE